MHDLIAVRILVCDDHDLIRAMIARLLRDEGHEVTESASAAEALAALDAAPQDAIVLDLHLRGESGLLVSAGVRADPARAGTPIILLSGDFDEVSEAEATRYGVDAVLPKPFEPELLGETLRRLAAAGADDRG